MINSTFSKKATHISILQYLKTVLCAALMMPLIAQAEITQEPLFLGGGGIPGNMVLVPSVEWPTIESVANQDDSYTAAEEFVGYFDPDKCYIYVYSNTESERYFKPNSLATGRQCTDTGEWSGNFLNWVATPTIDPFRKALTGGLRVKDTPTETWLEKARSPGQGGSGIFPIRDVTDNDEVHGATPFDSAGRIRVRVHGLGSELRFSLNNYDYNDNPINYNPGSSDSDQNPYNNDRGYEMSVRVSVCDDSVGVEENCNKYDQGWKPEGLLQQNAESIRFSVFGYLNHSDMERDGGVLRARQKYVGPRRLEPGQGFVDNSATEWDKDTGVFIQNPDAADAAATASYIQNSGVINYLNKFGQLTSGNNKSFDPVSELYYAATRYLKNQGNVSEYSDVSSGNSGQKAQWRDSFPVIENWNDPIEYACQQNVFLGIGDANTHRDKNLPGNTSYFNNEPAKPSAVSSDTTIDVVALTNHIASLEGLGNIGSTNSFSGRNNSAYIAGIAWDNRVRDMRPDLAGEQTASTHWVDVLENQVLEPAGSNQYYLATKYGGFDVPDDFDPDTHTGDLTEDWWHTNGETLDPNSGSDYKRPDNYYLAGAADTMIKSLKAAFANVAEDLQSSSAAVAANSTRLDTDTAVFQAAFNSNGWGGELAAYSINSDGTVAESPEWTASTLLNATNHSTRKIFTNEPMAVAADGESYYADAGAEFLWDQIHVDQQTALKLNSDGSYTDDAEGADRLSYLRGDRTNEQTDDDQSQPFRQRDTVLGDIINSNPQFSNRANFAYDNLTTHSEFNVTQSYSSWRDALTRPPVIYVGGNDGMFHAFNAELSEAGAGAELFAYIPSGVVNGLYELTDPEYTHRYYVDGTARVADAWVDGEWKTLAAGTTGAGGSSVFVLDVTDPENFTASEVLWEFSHEDMGYTIQQPSIVALPSGKFGVVVTSGYHDTSISNGYVWILDVDDGSIIKEFELNSGDLGSPLVVDLNFDRIVDRLYVGDDNGNLWRLDLEGADTANWDAPATLYDSGDIQPLFEEPDGRPITAQLTSAYNEAGKHMVFFGTGSFIRVGENIVSSPEMDYFYGIIDGGYTIDDRDDLQRQRIIAQGVFATTSNGYRVVEDNDIESSDKGWYIPLAHHNGSNYSMTGERVVTRAIVRGDRVIFTTLIPDEDPCAFGGDSWLMEVSMEDGGRLDYTVFDYNEDSDFDGGDYINIGTEDNPEMVPGSGINQGIGIINTPAVITGVGTDEVKVISGSSGQLLSIPEAGSANRGRQAWEQLR